METCCPVEPVGPLARSDKEFNGLNRLNWLNRIRRFIGSWQILIAEEATATAQMALDEGLATRGRPTLRLFRWASPAVSLGFKQRAPEWCDPVLLTAHDIGLVERPTGGGLAVHGSDLCCSVVAPSHPRLRLKQVMTTVCESLARALRSLGAAVNVVGETDAAKAMTYCLTDPSPYAFMVGQRKLGGFAIRRYPKTWLIQGSLLVRELPEIFRGMMPREVYGTFQACAISLEEAIGKPVSDSALIASILDAWRTTWGIPINFASQNLLEVGLNGQSLFRSNVDEV